MAAQSEMTRARTKSETSTEPQAEPKSKVRRANLKELFDLVDDIWGYIELCESRSRFVGRPLKDEINAIRSRMGPMRELLHGNSKNDPED